MKSIRLIQVPYDSGWRDVRMGQGPGRFIQMGAEETLRRSAGAVESVMVEHEQEFVTEIATTFELLHAISSQVREASNTGKFPLILAGNCDSTVGAVAGLDMANIGLIWLDGHGDFNTPETTIGGFLDGMGISMAAGHCWATMCNSIPGYRPLPEERIALVGARDLDEAERERLQCSGISRIGCGSIREFGAVEALKAVLNQWGGKVDGIYMHIDMDVHDPSRAPANPLQPDGGLFPQEIQACVQAAADRHRILGASITAYDPAWDEEGKGAASGLALVELIGSIAHQQDA